MRACGHIILHRAQCGLQNRRRVTVRTCATQQVYRRQNVNMLDGGSGVGQVQLMGDCDMWC